MVIASAKGAPLYEVDLTTLEARQLPGEQNLHIYDLASKYFVNDRAASGNNAFTNLDIYPTRVDEQFVNVHVNNKNIKGNIKLNIFDMAGKIVMSQSLPVKEGMLNQKVYLRGLITGAYIVNVADESGKVILNRKILITE